MTIIAVRRVKEVYTNPEPDFKFKQGGFILFAGERAYEYGRTIFQR